MIITDSDSVFKQRVPRQNSVEHYLILFPGELAGIRYRFYDEASVVPVGLFVRYDS